MKSAVQAGVASIDHGSMLDEEAIRLMKQHGTYSSRPAWLSNRS